MDTLVALSMKSTAKCDKSCVLQKPRIIEILNANGTFVLKYKSISDRVL